MSDNSFHLVTLGALALDSPGGEAEEGMAAHRQKLAVLAVLALSDRPLTRDALIGLFWADQEQARARHSLSNALSSLRRLLGPKAIRRHRDEVALESGVPLVVDVRRLEAAVAADDWATAVDLYRGPFLAGVFVGGSAAFEQWVDGERARVEALFLKACAGRAAELSREGEWDACAEVARRWLAAAPLSTEAATTLLDALTAAGTRDADQRALAAYDRLATELGEQFGRRPDRAVIARARELVERLRATDATGEFRVPRSLLADGDVAAPDAAPPPAAPVDGPAAVARPVERPPPRAAGPVSSRRTSPWRRWALRLVPVGAVFLAAVAWWRSRPDPARGAGAGLSGALPTVAIGAIRVPPDSGTAWLADGMVQMVGARLARSSSLGAVAPDRMRELLPPGASLSQLLAAARRVGARWAVSGAVTRSEQGLIMDVNVHDVAEGRLASLSTVTASDAIALADLVAVRVLAAAGSPPEGPGLAEIETASPAAYEHFVRFAKAADESREDEAIAALDAAIALDSGFVSALRERAIYAFPRGEQRVLESLLEAFRRNASRATEYDRLFLASQRAFYGGDHARSETEARQLVDRYPQDPRTHAWLIAVYLSHGRWDEAGAAVRRLLALDSVTVRADAATCVPCRAYQGLAELGHLTGDLDMAERAARRLTTLAPHLVASWDRLGTALAAQGRYREALEAVDRGLQADNSPQLVSLRGRVLMMARDWDAAEELVRDLRGSGAPHLQPLALDLSATLARERGRYRASIAALDSMARLGAGTLGIVAGNSLARIGEYRRAVERLAAVPPVAPRNDAAGLRTVSLVGDLARAFSWHRTLEADAIAAAGDTTRLRAIADSLELLSGLSYYGRDWRLHSHVRGLLLARQGRHEEAAAAFRAARWGAVGFTRSIAEEARSLMALDRPADALAALRQAYAAPLDAMGRYLPRTEIDLLMALAFRQAGQADSSAAYAAWVREAWSGADPEALRLLDALR